MSRLRRRTLLLPTLLTVALAAACLADTAAAHGLQIIGRKDVPLPDWLFVWGAAAVLILSFLLLSNSWREPRFAGARWRPLPDMISKIVLSRAAQSAASVLGVALLGLVVWSGLAGVQLANENFAPTFVFVTFWLGLVPFSLLFGDIFRALSPWAAMGRGFEAGFRLILGRDRPPPLSYPEWLGRWPAAIGLLGFLWFELVFGFAREGISPHDIAIAASVYTLITFLGVVAFGADKWIDRGESFGAFYGMIATLAPLSVRGGALGVRPPLVGISNWPPLPGSVALICVSIGGTIYDGALESILNGPIRWLSDRMLDIGIDYATTLRLSGTLLLIGCVLLVAGVFWVGVWGMRTVPEAPDLKRLGSLFAPALLPIAIGYFVAHYFSLFFFVEQAQFGSLLSDPLGRGWDLFGTAANEIDYGSLSASAIWYVQVGALVAGHIAGLVLAHDRALEVFPESRSAIKSQYWMLFVMVAFTVLGMYLLSESNQ